MGGQKILLYSKTIHSCPCYKHIFSSKYDTEITNQKPGLLKKLRSRQRRKRISGMHDGARKNSSAHRYGYT